MHCAEKKYKQVFVYETHTLHKDGKKQQRKKWSESVSGDAEQFFYTGHWMFDGVWKWC